MRDLVMTDEFLSALEAMSADKREHALKKLRLLAADPRYPSLQAHPVHSTSDKWECYITKSDRVIYESDGDKIRLWKIGGHRLIDRAHQLSFSPHTPFRRLDLQDEEEPTGPEEAAFEVPSEWLERPADNPFAYFPPSHLRILGVPSDLVDDVRDASHMEDIEDIPGLPDHTVRWLLELMTDPELEDVVFNPGRLIFRTTLDRLEGYCEGRIKRLMLNLSAEQERFVNLDAQGAILLRGCAGSGKTTVAIYRAIRLAATGARVIFLTYNKTLASVARTLIRELIGPLPDNLHVVHLDAFLVRMLRSREHTLNIASSDTHRELIEAAIRSARKRHRSHVLRFSWSFFRDEFEQLIKGKGLSQRDDYLAIPRYGRESPLRRRARLAVWDVYETYQDDLQQRGLMDWQDVTLQAYQELWSQPLSEPYAHVVIDEAQDLTVMQLRAAQRLNKGGAASQERSIFLVGDVAQTLYSRGFRWKEAGLQVVGRSYSIRRNFRNTRQIAEASAVLYAYNRRLKLSEDYVDPTFTQRQGAWPIVLECDVTDREPRAVYDKILSLVEDQRFRLADFAILSPTRALCDTYRDALKMVQIPCVVHTEKEFDILEERVKILTIHSAKGLEFPIVFLVGLHNGTLPRRIRGWDDEEAAIELERNRNVMYVGMTRAAEALYLVTSERAPSSFLSEIGKVVRYEPFVGGKV